MAGENRTSGTEWGVSGNRHSYHDGNYYWARIIGDNYNIPQTWYDGETEDKDDPRIKQIYDSYVNMRKIQIADFKNYEIEFAAILSTNYVKKFSRYFRDDWDQIYLFKKSEQETQSIVLEYLASGKKSNIMNDLIGKKIEHVFHNYDGILWEFYTSDESLYQIIVEHIDYLQGIEHAVLDFPGVESMNNSNGKYLSSVRWVP